MYSIVNHLKKNESLINRQLCIIDSNSKNENESTSSFSNKLLKTEKRVCKIDMIDANVSNTLYNIDNNSVLLDIDEGLLNGEIVRGGFVSCAMDSTERIGCTSQRRPCGRYHRCCRCSRGRALEASQNHSCGLPQCICSGHTS